MSPLRRDKRRTVHLMPTHRASSQFVPVHTILQNDAGFCALAVHLDLRSSAGSVFASALTR